MNRKFSEENRFSVSFALVLERCEIILEARSYVISSSLWNSYGTFSSLPLKFGVRRSLDSATSPDRARHIERTDSLLTVPRFDCFQILIVGTNPPPQCWPRNPVTRNFGPIGLNSLSNLKPEKSDMKAHFLGLRVEKIRGIRRCNSDGQPGTPSNGQRTLPTFRPVWDVHYNLLNLIIILLFRAVEESPANAINCE